MVTFKFHSDPYAAVRLAFFELNPWATDEDWEYWISRRRVNTATYENYAALELTCKAALESRPDMDTAKRDFLVWARTVFEFSIFPKVSAALRVHESVHVPAHMLRRISKAEKSVSVQV